MPTSVRLDGPTRLLLQRLANRGRRSKSEVIREAIEALAAAEAILEAPASPSELAADLIGCVSGGSPDLSEATGVAFTELLARRRGAGQ